MNNIEKNRPIRSFVKREGRLTASQRRAIESLWGKYGIDYSEQLFDFSKAFGREAHLVLEIGFGNGESLLKMALESPEINFIGIEVHRPGVGNLLSGMEREGCQNLRIISHDAVEVLAHMIGDRSLSKVQIFFPDPWPKKRHHKRRLIQEPFVQLLHRRLKPKGIVHLATDWENYAVQMMEVLSSAKGFKNLIGEQKYHKNPREIRPLTKFERRGIKLDHPIWDVLFITT